MEYIFVPELLATTIREKDVHIFVGKTIKEATENIRDVVGKEQLILTIKTSQSFHLSYVTLLVVGILILFSIIQVFSFYLYMKLNVYAKINFRNSFDRSEKLNAPSV